VLDIEVLQTGYNEKQYPPTLRFIYKPSTDLWPTRKVKIKWQILLQFRSLGAV